jgi:uncharacterized membrane protein
MSETDRQEALERESSDPTMDLLVGYLLLGGVLTSAALIVAGLIWRYISTGRLSSEYTIEGMNLAQFVWEELRLVAAQQFRPRLLINLGIAVLLLTPFARVLASMLYFALGLRNWKYTLFTGFVLAVLTYSLFVR